MNPNIHILSTRNLENAFITKASGRGIHIDTENFIETRPLQHEALKEQIKQLATQPLTAVFTSAHAVIPVFSGLHLRPQWDIFCISGATRAAVLAFMPESAIVATADYGAALAEKILSGKATRDSCFFCGSRRLNTIPKKLKAAQIPLRELVVYETELRPQKINQDYDGILFFSPSAAESFFSLNKVSEKTILFSIGNTTGKTLKKHSGNRIITGETPGTEQLLERVLNFNFNQKL